MNKCTGIFILILIALICLPQAACARKVKAYLPDTDKANGAAVVVCPGGSYYWLSKKVEGRQVAEKLRDKGFAAFVLHYRHAGTRYFLFRGLAIPQNHYPDPQSDLAETIAGIRARSEEYGIDPHKVGAMGFSAGGHLVLSAGEGVLTVSNREMERPDFVVSVYPVVTLVDEEMVHDRSRRALLGGNYMDEELRQSLSMELDVPADMPPVFLINCREDGTVDYRNSVAMDSALTAASLPHEYHLFEEGDHGFGVSSDGPDWFPLFLDWYGRLYDE